MLGRTGEYIIGESIALGAMALRALAMAIAFLHPTRQAGAL